MKLLFNAKQAYCISFAKYYGCQIVGYMCLYWLIFIAARACIYILTYLVTYQTSISVLILRYFVNIISTSYRNRNRDIDALLRNRHVRRAGHHINRDPPQRILISSLVQKIIMFYFAHNYLSFMTIKGTQFQSFFPIKFCTLQAAIGLGLQHVRCIVQGLLPQSYFSGSLNADPKILPSLFRLLLILFSLYTKYWDCANMEVFPFLIISVSNLLYKLAGRIRSCVQGD